MFSGLVPCTTTMSRIPMAGMSSTATGEPGAVGPSGASWLASSSCSLV